MPTLNWLTRDDDLKRAGQVPYRLLEADPALSAGDPASGNMLIQGDNLEALKSLLPYYAGQVKCIYIDPPFNTGEAFDNYDDNVEHSIWLGLMYPRLQLLRDLLSENGSLFVHLDDNEVSYATVILDEIFGRSNRIAQITFKQSSVSGPKARNPGVVSIGNYILLYSKRKGSWFNRNTYRAIQRDIRYGQYIENFEDDFSDWRFIPLTKALESKVGKSFREWEKEVGRNFDREMERFVLSERARVVQLVSVAEKDVSEEARFALRRSKTEGGVFRHPRESAEDYYFIGGKQVAFYRSKTREIDGHLTTAERVSNIWDDLLSNNVHQEGGVRFPNGKKPEALIKRCLEISTCVGDLVVDSFLGSGTTAAVATKMGRRWIGIEMGEHAVTHCQPRAQRVVAGDATGISKAVGWQGGSGFNFYRLGDAVFDAEGRIQAGIGFRNLATHVWFSETGLPLRGASTSPFLGHHDGRSYALLYNGVLRDRRPQGGNVLTNATLAFIREAAEGFGGPLTIYGEASRLSEARLRTEGITFKQVPYDVKAR